MLDTLWSPQLPDSRSFSLRNNWKKKPALANLCDILLNDNKVCVIMCWNTQNKTWMFYEAVKVYLENRHLNWGERCIETKLDFSWYRWFSWRSRLSGWRPPSRCIAGTLRASGSTLCPCSWVGRTAASGRLSRCRSWSRTCWGGPARSDSRPSARTSGRTCRSARKASSCRSLGADTGRKTLLLWHPSRHVLVVFKCHVHLLTCDDWFTKQKTGLLGFFTAPLKESQRKS